MQRLKRATIIGETTRGATMPGGTVRINDHFVIWISTGRSATGTAQNENRGTPPDVAVPVEKALAEAHRQALDRLAQTADPEWKAALLKIRSELANTEAR
jgi:C-terminal processing protease CtpA/Prc